MVVDWETPQHSAALGRKEPEQLKYISHIFPAVLKNVFDKTTGYCIGPFPTGCCLTQPGWCGVASQSLGSDWLSHSGGFPQYSRHSGLAASTGHSVFTGCWQYYGSFQYFQSGSQSGWFQYEKYNISSDLDWDHSRITPCWQTGPKNCHIVFIKVLVWKCNLGFG